MFPLCKTMRNLLDKYQGKKISLLAQLYYTSCSPPPGWAASAARCTLKPTGEARNEMMEVATVQTYPYFSLMT